MLKINKKMLLLVVILTLILSTRLYADDFEAMEESQIIVGPIIITNDIGTYGHMGVEEFLPQAFEVSSEATGLLELKEEINHNFKNYETSFTISYNGDTANLKEEIGMLIAEITNEDEYFSGTYSRIAYGYSYYANSATITFTMDYLTNKSQELFVDSKVKDLVAEMIEPGMNDFDKVKTINDWVVLNTEYSELTSSSPHAAYSLFKEGKGVCQAYALATYRLLEEAGLEVRYVAGTGGGVGHAWNQVRVEGIWYNLDTTWNDPFPNELGKVSYNYFLISDASLKLDHTPDDKRVYEVANDNRYENVGFHNMASVGNGYTMLSLNEKQSDPKYMWKVRLNKPVISQTANFNSLYIEDDFGRKLNSDDFIIGLEKDDPTLININIISESGYLKNKIYYVVVNETLESMDNKYLADPVKMPFIIR